MTLTDLAPLERWRALEEELHARSGMDVSVFDPRGYRILPEKRWANRLCPAVKETDKGQSFICAPAHMNLAAQAARTRRPVIEECDAGMIKIVVPIFAGGEFVGAVGACGLRFEDAEIDAYLVSKMTDLAEERVEELAQSVAPFGRAEAEALAELIQRRVAELLSGAPGGGAPDALKGPR